jgi:hypothetical protein
MMWSESSAGCRVKSDTPQVRFVCDPSRRRACLEHAGEGDEHSLVDAVTGPLAALVPVHQAGLDEVLQVVGDGGLGALRPVLRYRSSDPGMPARIARPVQNGYNRSHA